MYHCHSRNELISQYLPEVHRQHVRRMVFGDATGSEHQRKPLKGILRTAQKLWWEAYGTSIAADGAMYRGQEPPLYDSPDRRLLADFGLGDPREQRQVSVYVVY